MKYELAYQECTAKEGYFKSSTPSSKIPVKANTPEENQRRKGGGKTGHKGYGRKIFKEEEADKVDENKCPDCGVEPEKRGSRKRAVLDCEPVKIIKRVYNLGTKKCPECGQVIESRAPGV